MIFIYILILILVILYVIRRNNIDNFDKILNINIQQPINNIPNQKPIVYTPIYAPWRMYYPSNMVYPNNFVNPNGLVYQNYQTYPNYYDSFPFSTQYDIQNRYYDF